MEETRIFLKNPTGIWVLQVSYTRVFNILNAVQSETVQYIIPLRVWFIKGAATWNSRHHCSFSLLFCLLSFCLCLCLQLSGGCELTVVLQDFAASCVSELSVQTGQTVELLERPSERPGWCLVRTTDKSPPQEGLVPSTTLCISHSRSSVEMDCFFPAGKGSNVSYYVSDMPFYPYLSRFKIVLILLPSIIFSHERSETWLCVASRGQQQTLIGRTRCN